MTKKKYFNKYFFLILVLFLFVAVSIFMFMFSFYKGIVSVQVLNATLGVDDEVGINLDTDKLHFGSVYLKGYADRGIILSSKVPGKVFVTSKDAWDWLYVGGQGLYVDDVPTSIAFRAGTYEGMPLGFYEGEIFVYIFKEDAFVPKFMLKGKLLRLNSKYETKPTIVINITNPEFDDVDS